MRSWKLGALLTGAVIALSAAGAVSAPARPQPQATATSPQVVLDWNATAVATAIAAGKSQPESTLYVGLTQAAVYDAVIAIEGGFDPYLIVPGVPPGASAEAAAAAAAHGVLVSYFPAQQAALDAAYATSLAGIPDGTSEDRGVMVGRQVATGLVAARIDDGRGASVPFDPVLAPGVWRPTPPALLPALHPWLGAMKPLVLQSASQFRPGPPPALGSARYARDFEEVRALRRAERVAAHARADRDGSLLDGARRHPVQPRAPHPRRQPRAEPARRGAGARPRGHGRRRRGDRLLGCQVHVRLLAARVRDPGRGHGRERPHDG